MTFDELCASTAEGPDQSHFTRQKAFGRDGLMLDGKAVLCSDPDGVVFRVGPDHEPEALAVPGAKAWTPMPGRGPKGWIVVPPSSASAWPHLADLAVGFVRSLKK
jgi:hypothetical protein